MNTIAIESMGAIEDGVVRTRAGGLGGTAARCLGLGGGRWRRLLAALLLPGWWLAGMQDGLAAVPGGKAGEALLVPLAWCDSRKVPGSFFLRSIDTQVVLTATTSTLRNGALLDPPSQPQRLLTVFDADARQTLSNLPMDPVAGPGQTHLAPDPGGNALAADRDIRWVFFDADGVEQDSAVFSVAPNSVTLFDWCAKVEPGNPNTDGVRGFLVFYDTNGGGDQGAHFAMWGTAYLARNDLQALAAVPVLPMALGPNPGLDPDGLTGARNEIRFDPLDQHPTVVPWLSGVRLNNHDDSTDGDFVIALRYLLDPTLYDRTEFVFWFDQVCAGGTEAQTGASRCDRRATPYETFDAAGQSRAGGTIDLSRQLNSYVFDASDPAAGTAGSDPWLNGMQNTSEPLFGPLANSGQVLFSIAEGITPGSADVPITAAGGGSYHAGVVFGLVYESSPLFGMRIRSMLGQGRGFR